jgi:hypothetical protein
MVEVVLARVLELVRRRSFHFSLHRNNGLNNLHEPIHLCKYCAIVRTCKTPLHTNLESVCIEDIVHQGFSLSRISKFIVCMLVSRQDGVGAQFVGLRYVMASRLHFRTFHIELNPASPADVVRLPQVLTKHALRKRGSLSSCLLLRLFTHIQHLELKMPFDISKAREHFPALKQDQVFLDNAGGSQALGEVIDSYDEHFYTMR